MQFLNLSNGWIFASFISSFLLLIIASIYGIFIIRNHSLVGGILFYSIATVAFQISYFFELYILMAVLGGLILVALIVSSMLVLTKSNFLSLFDLAGRNTKRKITKVFNKEFLFDEVTAAINFLASKKIGALITFERNRPLDEFLLNGVEIDAPVSHQILETIFYPGTPLHDGAVIIRKNMIIAASVYFSPTTRPMRGKLGSRHRAAIGISELSDAITIIVSEETGRVSLTQNGEMEEINIEHVYRVLEEYLS